MLPKENSRFTVISTSKPTTFCSDLEKMMLRFVLKHKRYQIDKIIINSRTKTGGNCRHQDTLLFFLA